MLQCAFIALHYCECSVFESPQNEQFVFACDTFAGLVLYVLWQPYSAGCVLALSVPDVFSMCAGKTNTAALERHSNASGIQNACVCVSKGVCPF